MKGILFIGDLNFNASSPGRRVDESYFETITRKLTYCLTLCEQKELIPVICGKLFYKSFDIKVISEVIYLLKGKGIYAFPSNLEWDINNQRVIPKSTMGLLNAADIVKAIDISKGVFLDVDGEEIFIGKESVTKQSKLSFSVSNLINTDKDIIEHQVQNNDFTYFINANAKKRFVSTVSGKDYINLGPVSRLTLESEMLTPCVTEWTPKNGFKEYVVPHETHIMDSRAVTENIDKQDIKQSDFAKLMKEEMLRLEQENDKDIIETELTEILIDRNSNSGIRNLIISLHQEVESMM